MNFDNLDAEKIKSLISQVSSLTELLSKLGGDTNSQTEITSLSNYLSENNIDFIKNTYRKPLTDTEIFKTNSMASSHSLRRRIIKNNLLPYKCAICGMDAVWNNQKLVLTLDHINGKNKDNRLENLRWVCPNCDSQLPTYGNRASKTKKEKICIKCGAHISKQNKSGLCKNCKSHENSIQQKDDNKRDYSYNLCSCGNRKKISAALCVSCENKRRIKKGIKTREEKYGITRETLKEQIRTTPFITIAKTYGVSDNAIRKWCKYYGLPSKTKEITSISDEDWKNI